MEYFKLFIKIAGGVLLLDFIYFFSTQNVANTNFICKHNDK